MELGLGELKARSTELQKQLAATRSARNRATRAERLAAGEDREADRARGRRRRREAEEERGMVRVRVAKSERPRNGSATARRLYHRTLDMLRGSTGISSARGSDGLHSLHFSFVARGLKSTTGRRWRSGEAERAAMYIVREDGLEMGEIGWWSSMGDDRNEVAAFCRVLENFEQHDRANANVYISEVIALPAELTARQRRKAVRRICRFFERRGLPYTAALHRPDMGGDQRNFHCHIIYSLRPCRRVGPYDWQFALGKESDINTAEGILARRKSVVRAINATLHAARIDKRYTHLSNRARRMAPPQPKVGQAATWAGRRLAALEAKAALLDSWKSMASGVMSALSILQDRLNAVAGVVADRLAQIVHAVDTAAPAAARSQTRVAEAARITTDRLARYARNGNGGVAAAALRLEAASTTMAARLSILSATVLNRLALTKDAVSAARNQVVAAIRGDVSTGADTLTTLRTIAVVRVDSIATLASEEKHRLSVSMLEVGRGVQRRETLLKQLGRWQLGNSRLAQLGVRLDTFGKSVIDRLGRTDGASSQALASAGARMRDHLDHMSRSVDARLAAMKIRIDAAGDAQASAAERSARSMASPAAKTVTPVPVMSGPSDAPIGPLMSQVSTTATAPVQRPKDSVIERLRQMAADRTAEAEVYPPPPPKRGPRTAEEAIALLERAALLREEARGRTEAVRRRLRLQALDRLAAIDAPVTLKNGLFSVDTDGLFDDERFVFELGVLGAETQAWLKGRHAVQRAQPKLQEPVTTPLSPSVPVPSAGLTLAEQAAFLKGFKGTGR